MHEALHLIRALRAVDEAGGRAAIATVVAVDGSAYRREGATMLIHPDGRQVCTISGGCLEPEVAEIGIGVLQSGRAVLRRFDLDEDAVWGLGLGCGGSVEVFIEAYAPSPAFRSWCQAVERKRPAALLSVVRVLPPDAAARAATAAREPARPGATPDGPDLAAPMPGARMFVDGISEAVGSLGSASLDRRFVAEARSALDAVEARSTLHRVDLPSGARAEIFVDVTHPPPRLLVFGAGHDAIPVVAQARGLGFDVTVVDARPAFVTEDRFPGAELVRSHPEQFADRVEVPARAYVIVMNHHLERDVQSFAFALEREAAYLGLLGPRSRFETIRDRLAERGIDLDAKQLERVHTPIGVDIGADTPEEIAVSVMAELIAVRGGYRAGFLRDREGPVHLARADA